MKGTLFLNNSNLKFKITHSDQLFFDLYEYSVSFHLPEAASLRKLTHEYITDSLNIRRQWASAVATKWGRLVPSITKEVEDNLHCLCDFLTAELDYKMYTGSDILRIYTNSVDLLSRIDQHEFLKHKKYSQVIVDRPRGTLMLKKSKYKHRVYFRSMKITGVARVSLKNFLTTQSNDIRLSPSLTDWLRNEKYVRVWESFFVDYNTETWPTMLSLVCPGVIRKTLEIITTK